jgi:hypothetical protein
MMDDMDADRPNDQRLAYRRAMSQGRVLAEKVRRELEIIAKELALYGDFDIDDGDVTDSDAYFEELDTLGTHFLKGFEENWIAPFLDF